MNFIIFATMYISYYGSLSIIEEGIKDGVESVKGKGYYFDYKGFIKDKIKNKSFKEIGSLIPLVVPIVNLMYSPLLATDIRDEMKNLKDYIKPKFSKKDEEKIERIENNNIEIPLKRIFINRDHLKGKYTLDEVKRLNEKTGYLYKVGTIDNRSVAIIGNYNQKEDEDHKVQIVEFLFEDEEDIKEYKFHPENELDERLNDKLFTVYSLTFNDDLEKCINEIKLEKIRKEKESLKRLKEEITTPKYENTNEFTHQKKKR